MGLHQTHRADTPFIARGLTFSEASAYCGDPGFIYASKVGRFQTWNSPLRLSIDLQILRDKSAGVLDAEPGIGTCLSSIARLPAKSAAAAVA